MSELGEGAINTETGPQEFLVQFSHEHSQGLSKALNAVIVSEIGQNLRSNETHEGDEKDAVEFFREKFMDASLNATPEEVSIIPVSKESANEILKHYDDLKKRGKLSEKEIEEYDKAVAGLFTGISVAETFSQGKAKPSKESIGFGPSSISSWLMKKGEKGSRDGLG